MTAGIKNYKLSYRQQAKVLILTLTIFKRSVFGPYLFLNLPKNGDVRKTTITTTTTTTTLIIPWPLVVPTEVKYLLTTG